MVKQFANFFLEKEKQNGLIEDFRLIHRTALKKKATETFCLFGHKVPITTSVTV